MVRLFVALELPDELRARLAALEAGVQGARWVAPENLHLTLRFIGEVPEPEFQPIAEALAAVAGAPFQLGLKGVGQFGDRRRARVLWAGVAPADPVQRLRSGVESRLQRAGLAPEGRKFKPHVTLARLRDTPLDAVGNFLVDHGRFESPPFEVSSFALFSSHLGQAGAIHSVEADYPLAAA